jgi:ubiquinone/menaquinone biosynthesis C-methylase UbiE
MLEDLAAMARARGLNNVEVVRSDELSIPLPDGTADAALAAFVLHEPGDPVAFLAEIRRLLRPGGRALVLDWQKRETDGGPPLEHRIEPQEAAEAMRRARFEVREIAQDNDDIYALLGTVPE